MKLLSGDAYYKALLHAMPRAQERIVVAAMNILWGEKIDAIFDELDKATSRGVRVHILVDNYARLARAFPRIPKAECRLRIKKTFVLLHELEKKGATVTYFGKIGLNPYKGRCHVKLTVIDDNAYSFGGFNMTDEAFDNLDYIFHCHNKDVADCLEQLVQRIRVGGSPLPNGEVPLGASNTAILFDGGRRKDSLIFNKACELTSQAIRVFFISQWVPSGRLASLISPIDACYFNRTEQMPAPDSWGAAFDQHRYHIRNYYTGSTYIHAKCMLFELPGGKKAVLTGSHNFSYRGVAFGTQEIALYSEDKKLWNELHTFIQRQLAS